MAPARMLRLPSVLGACNESRWASHGYKFDIIKWRQDCAVMDVKSGGEFGKCVSGEGHTGRSGNGGQMIASGMKPCFGRIRFEHGTYSQSGRRTGGHGDGLPLVALGAARARTGEGRLVALALLVLILFPVISVTDDLMAVQNPAETDSSLRRDHLLPRVNSTFLATAGAPEALFAEQTSGCLRLAAPGASLTHILISPAMSPIENRPPPAA